jgi:hypothetical protein
VPPLPSAAPVHVPAMRVVGPAPHVDARGRQAPRREPTFMRDLPAARGAAREAAPDQLSAVGDAGNV